MSVRARVMVDGEPTVMMCAVGHVFDVPLSKVRAAKRRCPACGGRTLSEARGERRRSVAASIDRAMRRG